jgi:predicted metal-dependent peptidase
MIMAKKNQPGAGKLSDTIDQNKDHDARQAILKARIALVLKQPFFGNLAMRLKLVNADSWLTTAATDGRHFYYNSDFILKLPTNQMMFLFCHELLHCAYDHMNRGRGYNRDLANIAMDYVVNADCIKYNLGQKITVVPVLYDRKYDDWNFEQVYDDLIKNAQKINIEDLLDQLLDDHLEGNSGKGEGDNEDDKDGKGNGRPNPMTPEERQAIKDEFKEAMLAAAQSAGAGNTPGNIKRMINELTQPKINWRELITQQIQSTIKNDYTWTIPNKKMFSQGFVLPNMRKDQAIDVCIAIDTSGSIGNDQLNDFFSEINGIMQSYDDYKVKIWCFDTQIHNPVDYTTADGDDLINYEAAGFGGTDFDVNWKWMKDEDVNPKLFIVFTDGEPYGSWGDENYCDTVWIIHNKYNKTIEPPFGIHAYYED